MCSQETWCFAAVTQATAGSLQFVGRHEMCVCVHVCSPRGGQQVTEEASAFSLPEHVPPTPAGPDSPVSPMKELAHAVHKQQRALEARLEACLEELRRLCLREAVRPQPAHTSMAFI